MIETRRSHARDDFLELIGVDAEAVEGGGAGELGVGARGEVVGMAAVKAPWDQRLPLF